MPITLREDFKEFLKSLNVHGIRYLLVGGYAVSIHGYPRYTGDLDVWISTEAGNAEALAMVVREFGFDLPEVRSELFQQPNKIIRLGLPPVRIELHTTLSGVQFEDCFSRRQTVDFDGLPVSVIGFENLLANKRASKRHKDLDDLERLERK